MRYQLVIVALAMLALAVVQSDEIKLEAAQAKITTVSAMRVRKAPQASAEEVQRLKLGTVVNAIARSTNQDTISGKTDYWYRVTLPNSQTGWLFGGLLLDYNANQRSELLRQIIEARLKAENTDFADRQGIYANTRAEFELLKLLALANTATAFPDNLRDKSPYREWLKAHAAEVTLNEFAGGYNLRSESLWKLEVKYHTLPIADRIAWEAAENPQPSDCEGDEVCNFFQLEGEIQYLNAHPNGAHAIEAIKNLIEGITDDVIQRTNAKGGDQYQVEEQTSLRKTFASVRLALVKTSAPEKQELLRKLEKIRK
jgi:hypothetical protein